MNEPYNEIAGRLIGAALADGEGWERLVRLTTGMGGRLSGSRTLEQAVEWAYRGMQADGLEEVRLLPVKVPHWVRGRESAEVLSPQARSLAMLGLGGSVATPPEGITAPVVVVRTFDELEALGRAKVEGRMVLYAADWQGYGATVQYRVSGAYRAARLGAAAVLVRSATAGASASPHTGSLYYSDDAPKIPAAALTVEDALWLRGLAESGHDIRVALRMEAATLPDADSANVVGQITGREKPEEVVVMGGHSDCWDNGQGAHDDGAGCVAAWQALRLIRRLDLRPRRTLRVVLWTNEENGLRGGRGYREWLGDDVKHHVAALEMDGGAERPIGFAFGLQGVPSDGGDPRYEAAFGILCRIGQLVSSIEAGTILRGGGAADIRPLMAAGVPGLGLKTVGEHYLDWHHSDEDTIDRVNPDHFRRAIALLGVFGYVLADMPERL